MKILVISDAWHPQLNGVVRTYEYLSEELVRMGHEIKVIGPGDFPLQMPMPGYAEIKLVLKPYARLKKAIEQWRPHHIHVATEGPLGIAARKYCVRGNLPFTTSYHTQFPHYVAKRAEAFLPFLHDFTFRHGKNFMRWFHTPSSALLVATQSLEDELRDWGFTMPIHRFSRGVHLDLFYPGPATLFQNLKRPVALYVGRIAIEKNLEDFLSMDWQGSKVLVGDGPSFSALSQKYPEAVFVGKKVGAELAEHYRSADVFAFPSRTDTFGIVLVEALACGLPVAAYNVIGPKDIITEPFLGALHPTDLTVAAREALTRGTPQERARYVKENYTWESAAHQFIAAISDYCLPGI